MAIEEAEAPQAEARQAEAQDARATAPEPIDIGLVIDGAEVPGEEGTYEVTNPVRPDEVVLNAPKASMRQLDEAVKAARRAQPAWAALSLDERAAIMSEAAAKAQKIADPEETARLLTREHGKVLFEAMFDAGTPGGMVDAFCGLTRTALGPEQFDGGRGGRTEVRHEPYGVVAAILPFNWPVAVLGNKAVPALLTGNAVVAKAPPTCPGAVLKWSAAFAANLPRGIFSVLASPEAALGEALVTHPGVDMVSFTGGVTTGQAVMRAASGAVRPVVLELGGNDPAIIASDVEVTEALVKRILDATFVTSGQVCMAIKRLYVPDEKVATFVEALSAELSKAIVGDGLESEVTMGPVHHRAGQDFVESLIAEATSAGVRVHRPATVRTEDASAGGYIVSPAIIENPGPDLRIVREEQFAPALPVIGYSELEEAVGAANDTSYGLCASIWTNDEGVASLVAGRLEAGTVFINQHGMSAIDYRAPMGGWKHSGYGLELGVEGMQAFTRPRVTISTSLG
ncbi:MAG: aldehyde dehydrogenase family protein [Acidimicrobiales bacterium]